MIIKKIVLSDLTTDTSTGDLLAFLKGECECTPSELAPVERIKYNR